jgi:hypothetical protein
MGDWERCAEKYITHIKLMKQTFEQIENSYKHA